MNKIKEIFNQMTDEEVLQGIREIKESDETGIIPDGIIRKYAKEVKSETNGMSLDLLHTMIGILKQGAFRWESEVKNYLILSGEGSYDTENQFVMECGTRKEAEETFETFKNGSYKDTYLMLYEGKRLMEK